MLQPHRVIKRSYDGKATDADVTEAVANFVIAYFCAFALLTLTLAAMHIDFLTASSAVASALAGAGPGLGPIVGPALAVWRVLRCNPWNDGGYDPVRRPRT